LLAGHGESAFEIAGENEFRKLWRAGDVRALVHDHKSHFGRNVERFEPRKSERRVHRTLDAA